VRERLGEAADRRLARGVDRRVRRAKRRRNERTQLLQGAFVAHCAGEIEVGCECGDAACADPVRLALDAYAAARADPRYFVVRPGHEDAGDTVMARAPRFSFVRAGEPGDVRD
jgi:hypothetical protein